MVGRAILCPPSEKNKNGAHGVTRPTVKILMMSVLFLAAINIKAAQITTLYSFNDYDGAAPWAGLIASGNTLYGTTLVGSTNGNYSGTADGIGTIFRINTDGTGFTNLYSFPVNPDRNPDYPNGGYPQGSLTLFSNILYGAATTGGQNGTGTIYKINTDGSGFTTLYHFSEKRGLNSTNSDGANPQGKLLLLDGVLYGTAVNGGDGSGTIFRVNADGTGFMTLHSLDFFVSGVNYNTNNQDGAWPSMGLTAIGNVLLYGTTSAGGRGNGAADGNGTLFMVTTNGAFTVIHNFSTEDGTPVGELTVVSNVLYGTTAGGGNDGYGTIFKINADGTGFTTLFSFADDEGGPQGSLIFSNNVLYGTTSYSVFKINTDGTDFTDLGNFGFTINTYTEGGIALAGNNFYVTTYGGGEYGYGTVLSISPSRPIINSIVTNTNRTVTISCSGDAGLFYLMQAATNLAASPIPWQNVSTNLADTNGVWQFTDALTNGGVFSQLQTNLLYAGGGSGPPNFGSNTNAVIGTNVTANTQVVRFYRAATIP